MKKLKMTLPILLTCLLLTMTADSSQAIESRQASTGVSEICKAGTGIFREVEWPPWLDLPALKTDENKIMSDKENGWQVAWAEEKIDYDDYFEISCAIYHLVNDEDTEPLEEFFEDQLDALINDLDQAVASVGKSALRDLLVKAFLNQGEPIQNAGFEIEAGIAKYNYWYDFSWYIPTTHKCRWEWLGAWTRGVCTRKDPQSHRQPWIPKHQMYIRYKMTGLPTVSVDTVKQYVNAELNGDMNADERKELIVSAIFRAIQERIPQVAYSEAYEEFKKEVEQASAVLNDPDYNNIGQIVERALSAIVDRMNDIASKPESLIIDYAESNRADIQDEIKNEDGGDWHVVWGVNMNEVEDAKLTVAIVASFFTGGAALEEYFDDYLERTMNKIKKQAPELESILEERVNQTVEEIESCVKSGFSGDHCEGVEVCALHPDKCFGKLEIKAGIATYDRWAILKYDEPRSHSCRWEFWQVKTDGVCPYTDPVEHEINMPNHHQPYIKFRFKDGRSAIPDGPEQSETSLRLVLHDSTIIQGDPNLSEVYVDSVNSGSNGDGSSDNPFGTVNGGVNKVWTDGTVYIAPGNYNESVIIAKPMTLNRWGNGGTVVIGQTTSSSREQLNWLQRQALARRVVIITINGRAAATGPGSGMSSLRDKLRSNLAPLGVLPEKIFKRSWNKNQDDNPFGEPWVADLKRELTSKENDPSYLAIIGHSFGGWAAGRLSKATSKEPDYVGLIDPVFGFENFYYALRDKPRGKFIENWYQTNSILPKDTCTGISVDDVLTFKDKCIGEGPFRGVSCGSSIGKDANLNHHVIHKKDENGNRDRDECPLRGKVPVQTWHTNMDEDAHIHQQIIDRLSKDIENLIEAN